MTSKKSSPAFVGPYHYGLAWLLNLDTLILNTLGVECEGVLSTGVVRMLVENRIGIGLTRSTIRSFAII